MVVGKDDGENKRDALGAETGRITRILRDGIHREPGLKQPNLLATKRKNGKNFLGLQELRGKRELQILHTKNKNGKQFRRKILWLTSITFCSPISSIHVYDEYTTNRTLASETTNNDLRWIFLESKRKPGLRHLGKFDTE
uniref:Uncharacterized protein n=1 Tax=Vespula pensylvanica TaxID=30213 RepID=A0A834NS75_VESPE|nr:hypothetical protein H0235_011483 [Vespula pensylvanica]